MMRPIEQGRMLQGLGLEPTDEVLEVGTGSGFVTACLSRLSGRVTSLEILESLSSQARGALEAQGIDDVDLQVGDALSATFDDQSFDAVVVTASVPSIPDSFVRWLRPGGRLFIVRGQSPAMEALLLTRTESGRLSEQSLFDTDLPRLIGAEEAPTFQF
jgi:protein-L-isoaspartate(D-aspartate) O-methyltransferase